MSAQKSPPPPERLTVGLDIGTTKIVMMIGKLNEHGKIEIVGSGTTPSTGVQRGMVTNIVHTIHAIKKAKEMAEDAAQVEVQQVIVGIAGQHIRSYHNTSVRMRGQDADIITEADIHDLTAQMQKMALAPGESIIDVIPQNFVVDDLPEIKDPIGMQGARIEGNYHIITGQVNPAKNIYRCVEESGMKVLDLVLEPLASSEAVLSEEEKEAGVALVDIGGGTTDIAIFQDGIIRHTAVIPFGGNTITRDIMTGCQLLQRYSEILKIKHGYAIPSQEMLNRAVTIPGVQGAASKTISVSNLANIIKARMEEILECVHAEIRNSGFSHHLGAGIVLTGGGSQLRHIRQLTSYVTGIDARIGLPNSHVHGAPDDLLAHPKYATSVGLMMMGFRKKYQIAAEPTHIGKEKPKGKAKAADSFKPSFLDIIKKQFNSILEDDTNDTMH
ncbi:MAG: cell division protein FtsA [Bacteroidia bacterium]|jgi:cell division protein FtsA